MKNNSLTEDFFKQFRWTPRVAGKLPKDSYNRCVISGMGGSMIAGQTLSIIDPELHVVISHTYQLPHELDTEALYIASSFSGNTEETIDAFVHACEAGMTVAVITSGGKLLELAKKYNVPYILLPHTGLEPRFTIGYQMIALLSLMGRSKTIEDMRQSSSVYPLADIEYSAQHLASAIAHKYPIIYSSEKWFPLSYIWKAAINEGMKVPCFVNTFPEENHNELEQFSSLKSDEKSKFIVVFLSSCTDHPRVQKRMRIVHNLYTTLRVSTLWIDIDQPGKNVDIDTLLSHISLGYEGITAAARIRNVDPFKTPEIAKLKEQLTK